MLKYFSICAMLVAFGTSSLNAQQQDLVLQKVEIPGADFVVIFVKSKLRSGTTIDVRGQNNSLIVHPTGDELAFAVSGEIEKMFKDIGSTQFPIHAFRVERKGSQPSNAVNVYIVPKGKSIASSQE